MHLGRSILQFAAVLTDGFAHFTQDMIAAFMRLRQGVPHDPFGDACDLNIHLQRGNTVLSAGHFKIHVAQVIFVPEDIRENSVLVSLQDQPHGNARHSRFQGHARIHQGQR